MPTHRLPVRALAAACGALAVPALATTAAGAPTPTPTPKPAPPALAPTVTPAPAPGSPGLHPAAVDDLVEKLRDEARRARERRERSGPSRRLRLTQRGTVVVPADAPRRVRRLLRAANRIAHKPYVWGGGHGSWQASGYDCSGSVGYALHAAGVLDRSVTSGDLAAYGRPGRGRWVTVYAHGGHTYMVVAGVRFDTTAYKQTGSRWTRDTREHDGYVVRHPAGL